ncbi:MAG: hypothetical protein H7Z38_08495 [Rubrivivax sp.]|nr:hypothetical protein [Pyrinomonadaceae bacterium]
MKALARLTVATVLACLLSLSALAGDMHTTITNPPPAPQTQSNDAVIQTNDELTNEAAAPGLLTEAMVAALNSLLSIF